MILDENMSVNDRDNSGTMSAPGSKRPYPKGRKTQLTAEWKNLVRARLAELGRDHRWLEAQLGIRVGGGMVSRMLSPGQQTSALAVDVCRILEIPMPVAATGSADEHELLAKYRAMSVRRRRHLFATIDVLTDNDGDED